ncbi:hypothetical protein A2U01_0043859, partial [Trifolium medium]|nr:hypothetical protein [Trifolium medium]
MSQESPKSRGIENKNATKTHAEETSSQNPRVIESGADQEIIVDAVLINMVLPAEGSTKKKLKRTKSKKKKNPKK